MDIIINLLSPYFDWLFFSRQNLKNTRKWKIDFFEEEEKHFWLCENFV
jgi:hypothetical protein